MSIFSPRSSLTTMRTRAPRAPDAGADRVDVGVVGPHGDLGAVPGLAGAGLDLDDAVGDLGHLELEEALDEARMGAAHDDLRALGGLADLDDVGLDPAAGLGTLVGDLLGLGQQRLDPTEVEQGVARVGLLDDAGDDVTLAAGVLLVLHLPLDLTDALDHDLLGGLGGDATEVVGGDVELGADRLAVLVELLGHDPDLDGVGIDGDPRVLVGAGHPLVGRLQRVGERAEERVDRDALVGGERLQRLHHLGVVMTALDFFLMVDRRVGAWSAACGRATFGLGAPGLDWFGLAPRLGAGPGFGGPHSKTVRALSMSS